MRSLTKFRTTRVAAGSLVAIASLWGAAAMAQQTPGPYVLGGAGLSLLEDAATHGSANSSHDFDPGWGAVGALGYAFSTGFRLEGELGYRRNDVDGGPGDARAWSLMGNALYDFNTGSRFTPYVGVGVGGARLKFNDVVAGTSTIDDSDTVLAYQGMAGVSYDLVSNLKLDLGYRYFTTQRPSFRTSTGGSVDSDYDNHAVMLGLRYQFNGSR